MDRGLKLDAIRLLVPAMPTPDELRPYLEEISANSWYSNFGPLNTRLEKALSTLPCCTVSSGTTGLELALQELNLPPQHARILVPSFTYPATVCAIINAGYTPVFCDVEPSNWCMSEGIARRSEGWYDAILPVCTFGTELPWINSWKGSPAVIDAAAAYLNHPASEAHATVYSLHATKVPGAGEGGFVVGSDKTINTVRRLSNFGFNTERHCVASGTNAKLSEYHAAVALASLAHKVDVYAMTDRQLDYQYKLLDLCPDLRFQLRESSGHNHSLRTTMEVLLPAGVDISRVAEYMGLRGIETRRWYFPLCHSMPAFKKYTKVDNLANSESISARLLGLPYHAFMSGDDITRVATTLKDAINV